MLGLIRIIPLFRDEEKETTHRKCSTCVLHYFRSDYAKSVQMVLAEMQDDKENNPDGVKESDVNKDILSLLLVGLLKVHEIPKATTRCLRCNHFEDISDKGMCYDCLTKTLAGR